MTTRPDPTVKSASDQDKVEHVDAPVSRATPAAAEHLLPQAGRPSHWVTVDDIEQELELLKNRKWLSEELIARSQKHWHCSRLQAVKYLLGGLDECSA